MKLSEIRNDIKCAEDIINCMLDKGEEMLINDLSPSNIEYAIDDIEDSAEYLIKWIENDI